MVVLCYTHIAYPTVLAPRRLDQLAGSADLTGLEEDMVVRVLSHMSVVITGGNHRRDGSNAFICHDILYNYGDNHSQAVGEIQTRPGSRHEYAFSDNHDNHIEDLPGVNKVSDCRSRTTYKHQRVILMDQIVSRVLQKRGTPSAQQEAIDGNNETWNFDPYQAVYITNRSLPTPVLVPRIL